MFFDIRIKLVNQPYVLSRYKCPCFTDSFHTRNKWTANIFLSLDLQRGFGGRGD